MGNNGQWIEVQIRSERMNDVAEQGFAAHWKYKEGGGSEDEGELARDAATQDIERTQAFSRMTGSKGGRPIVEPTSRYPSE